MLNRYLKRIINPLPKNILTEIEEQKILIGKLLSKDYKRKKIKKLNDIEFKIFSQFGDDGIIQYLINNLDIKTETFIEFGVEDYLESNTRYLLINNNWSGFVMDGDNSNIESIKKSYFYWKHDLEARSVFITKNNINSLLSIPSFSDEEIGLLHIDLDGNDFFIWREITIKPIIVIIEYNSVFGIERPISIPYSDNFIRTKAHFSNLYWGASLKSLYLLAKEKGYAFVGCNSAGNNAYFVRKDKINTIVKETTLREGYVESKYRESRNADGKLTYLSHEDRSKMIKGLPVFNIVSEKIEKF